MAKNFYSFRMMISFFNLTVVLMVVINHTNSCPVSCTCYPSIKRVDCTSKGLTAVPNDVPNDSRFLDLSANEIIVIPARAFNSLQQLEKLNLIGNEIAEMAPGTFNNLPQLKTLYLTSNQITVIPAGVFSSLNKLQRLYLYSNKISELATTSFEGLPQLRKLSLSGNEISELPPNIFRYLPQLEELSLWDNNLKAIRSQTFSHLIKLQTLWLNGNQIKTISSTAFKLMPDIKEIKLRGNPLNCSCEEKYLLDWEKNRNILKNAECRNFGNRTLTDAVNSYKENCPNNPGPFGCLSCDHAKTISECQEGSVEECIGDNMACHVQLKIESKSTSISSQCQAISVCTESLLPANLEFCPGSGNQTCNLCCAAPNCVTSHLLTDFCPEMTYRNEKGEYFVPTKFDGETVRVMCFYNPDQNAFFRCAPDSITKWVDIDTSQCITSRMKSLLELQVTTATNDSVASTVGGLANLIENTNHLTSEEVTIVANVIENVTQDFCPEMTYRNEKGEHFVPTTFVGKTVRVMCLYNHDQNAIFRCAPGRIAKWVDNDTSRCIARIEGLLDLQAATVTNDSVAGKVGRLANLTENTDDFTAEEVTIVANMIENVTQVESVKFNATVGREFLESINSMLDVDVNTLVESEKGNKSKAISRMISAVETMGNQLLLNEGVPAILVQTQVAVAVTPAAANSSLMFVITGDLESDLSDDRVNLTKRNDSGSQELVASLHLPASVVAKGNKDDNINFVIYIPDTFFKAAENSTKPSYQDEALPNELNKCSRSDSIVDSPIVAATVGRKHLTDLKDPVTIKLKQLSTNTSETKRRCAFWNETLNEWSENGCKVMSQEDDITTCQCNHLTNFALLMDVYGNADRMGCDHKLTLLYISYIGCAVSMVGLVLTLITYFTFRKQLLKANPAKILVNLCIALLGVLAGFLISTQITTNYVGCKIGAMITHYFLLASMFWMLIDAFNMCVSFVMMYDPFHSKFIRKCSLIGWGLPTVVVILTISISRDNYGLHGEICWLSRIPFLAALMAPVALILALNFVAFGLVIYKLIKTDMVKIQKTKKGNIKTRLRGAMGIIFLLGLTWIFAFCALGDANIVFQYLFALFNSLQGLFIFIFHCLFNEESRKSWLECCRCACFKGSSLQSQTVSSRVMERRVKDSASSTTQPQAMELSTTAVIHPAHGSPKPSPTQSSQLVERRLKDSKSSLPETHQAAAEHATHLAACLCESCMANLRHDESGPHLRIKVLPTTDEEEHSV